MPPEILVRILGLASQQPVLPLSHSSYIPNPFQNNIGSSPSFLVTQAIEQAHFSAVCRLWYDVMLPLYWRTVYLSDNTPKIHDVVRRLQASAANNAGRDVGYGFHVRNIIINIASCRKQYFFDLLSLCPRLLALSVSRQSSWYPLVVGVHLLPKTIQQIEWLGINKTEETYFARQAAILPSLAALRLPLLSAFTPPLDLGRITSLEIDIDYYHGDMFHSHLILSSVTHLSFRRGQTPLAAKPLIESLGPQLLYLSFDANLHQDFHRALVAFLPLCPILRDLTLHRYQPSSPKTTAMVPGHCQLRSIGYSMQHLSHFPGVLEQALDNDWPNLNCVKALTVESSWQDIRRDLHFSRELTDKVARKGVRVEDWAGMDLMREDWHPSRHPGEGSKTPELRLILD